MNRKIFGKRSDPLRSVMSVYDKSERALRPVAYEALHLDL